MSVISSCLTHGTKMETQRGTRVTFLDTNGNARPSADARDGEIFIFFRALAFTHLFALHTCKLGQRKCKWKRKVKTAWTCEGLLRSHLRRRCEPGHDISFENPPYTVKNADDEIMYDGTTAVRVSQWRLFLLKSELSGETLTTNLQYEPRKALLCRTPFITTYFQRAPALTPYNRASHKTL